MPLGDSSYTRGPPSSVVSGASATNASWMAARSAAEAAVGMGDFLEAEGETRSVDALLRLDLDKATAAVLITQRDNAEDARALAQAMAGRQLGAGAHHDA